MSTAGTRFATGWEQDPSLTEKGEIMFRTIMGLLLLAAFTAGCNTMQGAGKDLERGGEKIQGAAERNK
jgi:entericidin B